MIGKETDTTVSVNGDGTAKTFPISYPVYEPDFVDVHLIMDEGLETETRIELTIDVDYTLTTTGIFGLQSALTLVDSGQAWFDAVDGGLDTDYKIYISATRDCYQPANLRVLGSYSPASIEKSLDRMALNVKRGKEYLDEELSDLDARFDAIVSLIQTVTGLPVDDQVLAEGGTITMDLSDARQHLIRVAGNGAAITTAAVPFSGPVSDGKIVMVMGVSNTSTVRINHNDVEYGVVMQGDIVLRRFDLIYFIYDATSKRFVEVSRSKQ